jgi:hypothetical protein
MMPDWFPHDPQEIVASLREQNEQILAASRRTRLDLVESCEQALSALADSREKLADASEIEWLSRVLRAQADFTREIAEASSKFARDVLDS